MMSGSAHYSQRLASFRQILRKQNVHAFVVPHNDAHFSEYICARDERIAFISGFTGSAGCCVITEDQALLWTDGRYFKQAALQLSSEWTLMKQGVAGVPTKEEWLAALVADREAKQMKESILANIGVGGGGEKTGAAANGDGSSANISSSSPPQRKSSSSSNKFRVGADPWLMSADAWQGMAKKLESVGAAELCEPEKRLNPVDLVWGEELPKRPGNAVRNHALEFAGKSRSDKLKELRAEMQKQGAEFCVVSALDEICWLLNLRGTDIPYNPVFFAFLVVPLRAPPLLYCDVTDIENVPLLKFGDPNSSAAAEKNDEELRLSQLMLKPYENVLVELENIVKKMPMSRVWCDPKTTPAVLHSVLQRPILEELPIQVWKGSKNSVELEGMRNAHVRDGAAKTKFLMWLEKQMVSNSTSSVTEVSAATQLENFRKQQPRFAGLSFPSISGSGPNGAIIHYHPEGSVPMKRGTLYLIDSGAQYLDGTTDVTRTVYIPPTESASEEGAGLSSPTRTAHHDLATLRRDYTLVLQGHIALATAVFPNNTPGPALDVLARMPLWKFGWNYNHGTGHGVGAHLNVHEGPHGIPWLRSTIVGRLSMLENGLVPGMIVSNEPGFYIEDNYGIRIENLVEVVRVEPEADEEAAMGIGGETAANGSGGNGSAASAGNGNDNAANSKKRPRSRSLSPAPPDPSQLPAGSGAFDNTERRFPAEEKHPHYKRDLQYCTFRNLTFVPLDKRLIDVAMLTDEERAYVDNYHAECYAKLAPFFEHDQDYTKQMLLEKCTALEDPTGAERGAASAAIKRRRVAV